MALLEGTSVRRGGQTAHYWYETIDVVSIDVNQKELQLGFSMSSKGGGRTQVQVAIKPESFSSILAAMASVDPDLLIQAMSDELARQIKCQPERQKLAILDAKKQFRDNLQNIARKKFGPTWFGNEKAEGKNTKRVVYAGINAVLSEVDNFDV